MTDRIGSITDAVAQTVKDTLPAFYVERLVGVLATREIEKNSTALQTAWERMGAAKREYKPDLVSYNIDGTKKEENWSKANLDARNKAQANLSKIVKALDLVFATGDFSEVIKVANAASPDV